MNESERDRGYGSSASADEEPRCWRCSRKLAEKVTRPWLIKCGRCKAPNADGGPVSNKPHPPI